MGPPCPPLEPSASSRAAEALSRRETGREDFRLLPFFRLPTCELHIVTQAMTGFGDKKSDWSYLLPATSSDDKILNSSRHLRSRLIHAQSKAQIDLHLTMKMLEFLSRAVANKIKGLNRTCQWRQCGN
ncbi:hypothetical protein NL676_014336 [Syzygium grande]|nr:hypothetical protein NL676_014336 [Syzygium grande]